jgi:hypothetical protein
VARLARLGVLVGVALVGYGCTAAKPHERAAAPARAREPSDAGSDCARYGALKPRLDAAVASGHVLRARRLLEQAGLQCPEAERARAHLSTASPEASQVSMLEAESGERLRLVQRWSVDRPQVLPHAPFAFTTLDEHVQIIDVRTGRLHARIPQSLQAQVELDLDANGTRVLTRSIDLTKVRGADDCASTIDIFEASSGARLKQECAFSWAFSADGSRLALDRLIGWGDGAIMKVVVLDTKTLEPVIELPEPGNVVRLNFAPDGTTLVTRWSNGVSLTDVVSGKTETWRTSEPELGDVLFGGGHAVWQLGSTAHVWSLSQHTHATFSLGTCKLAAVSRSGARLAASCDGSVTLWSMPGSVQARARRLSSISLPKDSTFWSVHFLRGDRAIAIELIGKNESSSKPALYDTERQRWLLLPQPTGDSRTLDVDLGLLLTGKGSAPLELFAIDDQARLRAVSLPNCEPMQLARGNGEGSAIVTCRGQRLLAAVLDLKTLAFRSFPVGATAQNVHGSTLVSSDYSALELRDLRTGALLPGSPVAPAPTAWDGWWDGSAFVTVAARDYQDEMHVVRFGAQLTREALPLPPTEPCKEHRGQVAWSLRPPFAICSRKTGVATRRLPDKALPGGQFDRPALSDDGSFAIAGEDADHAYRVADGAQIPLVEAPRGLQFVGPELLVGFDEAYDWGFWSAATGRRLTRSSEKLGNLPIAASAAQNLAIEAGRPLLVVRDFAGNRIGTIPVDQKGDVALSERGVLSVVEPSRVSFFQLPQREPLGVLLNHPSTGEVAFLAATGELELTGEPLAWRQLLRCQVGTRELPLELCLDAWLEPGIGARRLLPGRSDL